jgi:hypothetical protein
VALAAGFNGVSENILDLSKNFPTTGILLFSDFLQLPRLTYRSMAPHHIDTTKSSNNLLASGKEF